MSSEMRRGNILSILNGTQSKKVSASQNWRHRVYSLVRYGCSRGTLRFASLVCKGEVDCIHMVVYCRCSRFTSHSEQMDLSSNRLLIIFCMPAFYFRRNFLLARHVSRGTFILSAMRKSYPARQLFKDAQSNLFFPTASRQLPAPVNSIVAAPKAVYI